MTNTIEQLQVLYEIAMSIGSSLDLRPMLKNSLSLLLKKLTCSAGGVLFSRPGPISSLALNDLQEIYFEEVFTIPRSIAHNKAYQTAIRCLPKTIHADRLDVFFQQLPLSGKEDSGSYFYILELPDIGLLILAKYGEGLDPVILKSLKILSNKLADACKACLQNAALRESEKRMTDIIYSMGDWVWEVDENGRYIYSSNKGKDLFGYTQEDVIGKTPFDFMSPEEAERVKPIFSKILSNKAPIKDLENWNIRKDGEKFCLLTNGVPILDENGILRGYRGVDKDITERKQAEEDLKKSEERFKLIFEYAPDAFYLNDLKGNFIAGNKAAEKMTGFEREELIGGSFLKLNLLSLDQLPKAAALLIKNAIGKSTGPDEFILKRKTGDKIPVEIITHPVKFEKRILVLGIARDITERKRAEEELKKNEEKYRSIFENVQDVYYETLLDGTILEVSPSVKLITKGQYNRTDLIGKSMYEFYADTKNRDAVISAVQKTGSVADFEVRLKNRDGSLIHCSISAKMSFNAEGRPEKIIGSMHDITERKRAEESFKKSEENLQRIMDSIHDIVYSVDGTTQEFTYISPAFERLLGYTMEDIRQLGGRKAFLSQVIQGGKFTEQDNIFQQLQLEKGEAPAWEAWWRCKDETLAYLEDRSVPVYDGKQLLGTQGVLTDITERKRTEEALRETTNYLENLLSFANAPIMVWDKNLKITKFNLAFERMTGYTMYDVLGKHPEILFLPEMREDLSDLISRTSEGENLMSIEMPVRSKDGSDRIVLWNTANIYATDEKTIIATIAHGQDITERKRAEEALRNEKILLRTVIDNIPDAIYAKDKNSRKTLANLADVHHMGVKSDAEVLGKDDFEFYPKGIAEGFYADDQLVIQTGQPVLNREENILDEKGKKRWVLTSKLPLRDGKKQIIGLIGIGHDFTESKRAEEALQESELRFRSLYENVTVGIYRTTPDGKILLANPALLKMLGYTSFEKLAERNLDKNGVESSSQRKEFLEKIERDGEVTGYESKWIRQDGKYIIVLESARVIRDSHGNTLYYDGTVENITEHKSLQNQILQTQKVQSIGTLAGGIAHDFNNILGIILAFTSVLERSEGDKEKITKSTTAITKAVSRGAALVRQILTFARQTGTLIKPMLIPDLVHEIVAMLKETFPEVIEFKTTIEDSVPLINADHSQMHQVLLNLCVNARDAMPKGGIISIEVKTVESQTLIQQFPEARNDRYIYISVSDTGTGMDEATRSRIFDPFFTTKEQGEGTGLGLSVVFGVIQDHHGFISVDSKVGQGTIFHLYLPVPQEKSKSPDVQKIRTEETQRGTETILFVEDEELLREIVQSILESNGYKVLIATNGREAVEIYKKQYKNISLVLSDMGLPMLGGIDVYAILKEINPDVKVIFASGFISLETRSELLKEGAKGFIQKPYNVNEVLQMVREVLDEKGENNEQRNFSH